MKQLSWRKNMGLNFIKRERERPIFCKFKCPNNEFWAHIADNTKTDYILFTHCTNPLIKEKTYDSMIDFFVKEKNNYDSFNSVTEVKEFLILKINL